MTANPFRFVADFVGVSVVLAREVHGLVAQQLAPVDPCVARPPAYEAALVEAEEAEEVTEPCQCQSCRWPEIFPICRGEEEGAATCTDDDSAASWHYDWPDVPAGDDATPQAPPAGQNRPLSVLLTRAAVMLSYHGHQRLSAELHDRAAFMSRIESE